MSTAAKYANISFSSPQPLETETNLDLRDWLDVSWLYPKQFEPERVLETGRSYIVVGRNQAYKFLRADYQEVSFEQRCRMAADEVIDHEFLAPGLYRELRPFRWIDGEPSWVASSGVDVVQTAADDLAVVMNRMPIESRLDTMLHKGEGVTRGQVKAVARLLSDFHQRAQQDAEKVFRSDPRPLISSLIELYLSDLNSFINEYGAYLDPYSQIALQESRGLIRRYMQRRVDRLFSRGELGLLIDGHGDLRSESVCFSSFMPSTRELSIYRRAPRASKYREGDVLNDVASLAIDLEVRGFPTLAKQFEDAYFELNQDAFDDELYRLHRVIQSIRRVEEVLESSPKDDFEMSIVEANQYLGLAFQQTVQLDKPFIVAISGQEDTAPESLGRGLSELLPVECIEASDVETSLPMYCDSAQIVFEKLIRLIQENVEAGKPVAVVWNELSEEDRLQLWKLISKLELPYLFVELSWSHEQRVQHQLEVADIEFESPDILARQRAVSWSGVVDQQPVSRLCLEPSIPAAELALLVVRELERTTLRKGSTSLHPNPDIKH